MSKLELKKFNMKKIKDDSVVVFIGKRNTGKSFLLKDLLFHKRDIPVGTVISGTEGANHFYSEIVPSLFIHEEYSPPLVSNVLKRQKKVVKRIDDGEKDLDPRAFLILDDCLYDSSWKKDKNMRAVFMNGRHYKLLFLLTLQYAMGVPPNLRTNIDYVFILRENFINNRRRLYDNYAGMFPTFEVFCTVMDQCTNDYECLVINNTTKSNKLEDQIFWYKANAHEKFRIGADVFWEHHEENYEDEEEEDNELDVTLFKKTRGPLITVKKL